MSDHPPEFPPPPAGPPTRPPGFPPPPPPPPSPPGAAGDEWAQPAQPPPAWAAPAPTAWEQSTTSNQTGWGQSTVAPRLQPVTGIARATMIALGVMAVLSLISVGLDLDYAGTVDSLVNGDGGLDAAIDAEDARGAFSVVFLGGVLVTAVFWVLWIQRARSNAIVLGAGGQRQSDGMAVACWFIPVANVVLGLIVMNDLWRANDPSVRAGYRIEGRPVSPIVALWWVLWMIGWWISRGLNAAADAAFDDSEIDTAVDLIRASAGVEVGFVVAAILALQIVRQITERQRQRAAIFGFVLT